MFSIERGGSIKSQGYESKINAFLLYICLNSYKPFGFQVYLLQEVINLFNFEYICRYYSTLENMGVGTKYICGCKEYKTACFFHVHPTNSKQQQIFTDHADILYFGLFICDLFTFLHSIDICQTVWKNDRLINNFFP